MLLPFSPDLVKYELTHGMWHAEYYARFHYDKDKLVKVTSDDRGEFRFEWEGDNIKVMHDVAEDGSITSHHFDRFDDKHNRKRPDLYRIFMDYEQRSILDFMALNKNNAVCDQYNKWDKSILNLCHYTYDERGNVLEIDTRYNFQRDTSYFVWNCDE